MPQFVITRREMERRHKGGTIVVLGVGYNESAMGRSLVDGNIGKTTA
jgi:hypothetical protein